MRVIAVEEHFSTPFVRQHMVPSPRRPDAMADGKKRSGADIQVELQSLGESRLRAMDEAGIDMQILSLTAAGAQGYAADIAIPMAKDANDLLHEAIKAHPTRYAGLAALPTIDPAASVRELERCVKGFGFKGTMINGRNQDGYLDDKKYWPIFEAAEALDVAVYLHPRDPHPDVTKAYYADYMEISDAGWGYGVETGTHFLRLALAGLFDDFPRLKFILGHLGEGLPFWLPRLNEHAAGAAGRRGLKKSPQQYITENCIVSCSGHFSDPAFICTMMTLGIDNMMFAVDWPFELNKTGMEFLRQLPISPIDKEKLAHGNAERIFKL